jgi:outer membrane protein
MIKTPKVARLLLPVTAAAFLLASASASAQQGMKIGTVDMNKIFTDYKKTQAAQDRLKDVEKAAQDELNERMESYKNLLEDIKKVEQEANNPALSNEVKEEKKKTFQEKATEARGLEREINEFRQTRQKQIQEQMLRMRKGLIDEIIKEIAEKVKVEKYDLVFDKTGPSATGIPIVVYARDGLDFSDPISEILNKKAGATPAPVATPVTPAPAPAPAPADKPRTGN